MDPSSLKNYPSGSHRIPPIHWIMFLNVIITAGIIFAGVVTISKNIRVALDKTVQNVAATTRAAQYTDKLVSRQLPLRKLVMDQRILVNRFAYELALFVAKKEPDIVSLESALNQMLDNSKNLEKNWSRDIPEVYLLSLKEDTHMAIGIFKKAAEFKGVGFGEIDRLAEESKPAIQTLIKSMDQLENLLDKISRNAADRVNQGVLSTGANAQALSDSLEMVYTQNQLILWIILLVIILFQAAFFFYFKKRLSDFSKITRYIFQHKDLSRRITHIPSDDLGRLAQSFNNMLETLEQTSTSQAFLDSITESMNDTILVLSSNGIIKKANSHAKRLMGPKVNQLINTPLEHLFQNDISSLIKTISQGQKIQNIEHQMVSTSGQHFPALISTAPLVYSAHEDKTGDMICIINDIQALKKDEQEKIQTQKIALEKSNHALIGRIAGKMAHDFNNVLGIIMGNTELSLMECQDPELKQTLELIFEQTLRGKNLTKNLMAFAKNREPNQKFFHINDKIDLAIQLLKKDLSDIPLVREDDACGMEIFADPEMIELTLVNLVQNAIHSVSKTDHPCITIRTHGGKSICIDIEDNGCGIPETYLDRIYDPAFTLKGSQDTRSAYENDIKGAGYGMANVKKYIDQHQGEILVESRIDKDTKVTICLPLPRKKTGADIIDPIQEPGVVNGKRILLVEDESAIFDVQHQILTLPPQQHRVDIAQTAKDAVILFDKHRYDLVSLDYILKEESTGMDVYQHIRKKDKTTPILFVSGNIEFLESIETLKKKDPLTEHLSKPCQNKDYLKNINTLLKKGENPVQTCGSLPSA